MKHILFMCKIVQVKFAIHEAHIVQVQKPSINQYVKLFSIYGPYGLIVPCLDRVRGAIVVSGKNLCLSVTQFSVLCNSETVEEIDTKLVL